MKKPQPVEWKNVIATLTPNEVRGKGKQSQKEDCFAPDASRLGLAIPLRGGFALTRIHKSISAILVFTFIATNIPRCEPASGVEPASIEPASKITGIIPEAGSTPEAGSIEAGSFQLAPQSRITNPLLQRQFATAASHIEKAPAGNELGSRRRRYKMAIRTRRGLKNRKTRPYPKEVERRVNKVLDRLYYIYGPGFTGKIRGVSVVPHLKGNAVSELRHGVVRIDEIVMETGSMELLMDVIEHELWHAALAEIDDNIGIQEVLAIYQSLKRFVMPNYDIEGWMEKAAVVTDIDGHPDRLLAAIIGHDKIDPPIDPESGDREGRAHRLYREVKELWENPAASDVEEEILGKIIQYVYETRHEREKGALRFLQYGVKERPASWDVNPPAKSDVKVNLVGRAAEALTRLERMQRILRVESYVASRLTWEDALQITAALRIRGNSNLDTAIKIRIDNSTRELTTWDLPDKEKGEAVDVVIGAAIAKEEEFVDTLKKRLTVFISDRDTAEAKLRAAAVRCGILESRIEMLCPVLREELARLDTPPPHGLQWPPYLPFLTQVKDKLRQHARRIDMDDFAINRLLDELEGRLSIFIPDGEKAELIIRSTAREYGLDETLFVEYRHMVLLQLLRGTLFRAMVNMRDASEGKALKLIFRRRQQRKSHDPAHGYQVVLKGSRQVIIVDLPVFLNDLWILLEGGEIKIPGHVDENGLWLSFEDMVKCAGQGSAGLEKRREPRVMP